MSKDERTLSDDQIFGLVLLVVVIGVVIIATLIVKQDSSSACRKIVVDGIRYVEETCRAAVQG